MRALLALALCRDGWREPEHGDDQRHNRQRHAHRRSRRRRVWFDKAASVTTNLDHVADFTVSGPLNPSGIADKIWLSQTSFTQVGIYGALSAAAFVNGTAAADASDRIVYDSATGALYYDADGTGAAAKVQFAVLDNKAEVTAADFVVV